MTPVSIIVNNYNYGALVARAVESALRQDYRNVEIVVVDDGSTDEFRSVLDRYRDRVRLVYRCNGGQAAAINEGVQASSGEILCFLDADDEWLPGKVTEIVRAMRGDPGAVLTYHRLQPINANGQPVLKPIPRTLCSGDLAPRLSRTGGFWPFPMTSSLSVRRSAWDEAGPIPEELRISADAWLVGVYPFVGRVQALPEILGYYHVHGGNSWFRSVEDANTMRRRMQHWRATVHLTNRFFEERHDSRRLLLADHLPYQLAEARLADADWMQRLRLALLGLRFEGEPNRARRFRDAIRSFYTMGAPPAAPEVPRP